MEHDSVSQCVHYIMRRQTGMVKRTERGETVRNSKVQITIDFDVTPHILRHTYITNLILSGANVQGGAVSGRSLQSGDHAKHLRTPRRAQPGGQPQHGPAGLSGRRKISPKASPNAPADD